MPDEAENLFSGSDDAEPAVEGREPPRITALAPLATDPSRIAVKVGRKRAAVVGVEALGPLGLQVGRAWTADLESRVLEAHRRCEARMLALRMISRQTLSVAAVRQRLTRKIGDAALAREIAEWLAERGVLDDQAAARTLAGRAVARGTKSRAGVRNKLRSKGIGQRDAEAASREALRGIDEAQAARELAVRRLSRMSPSLDPQAASRRLFGFLARRGFDSAAARDAVKHAMTHRGNPISIEPEPDE